MVSRIGEQPDRPIPDAEDQPRVVIVILNWNGAATTFAAVASLSQLEYRNWHLVVIDNGSTDGSLDLLRPLASETTEVISLAVNTGYTGGSNFGLRHAIQLGAKYVWLLNSDAITEPHTLSALVAAAESDPHVGLASPLIASIEDPNQIVIAGAILDRENGLYADTHDLAVAKRWVIEHPGCEVVHGTAMLVTTELARTIGLLDNTLFAYYEDIDYSLRSLSAGYRNVTVYSTKVLHDNKNMYKRPEEIKPHYWYYMSRNEMLLLRKHLSFANRFRALWRVVARFLALRSRYRDASGAMVAGLWHGCLNRGGPYQPSVKVPRAVVWLATLYERLTKIKGSASASSKVISAVKS